jgi:ABC-2 type transport system ATP-binding protein
VLGEAHHGAEPNEIGAKVTSEDLVPQVLAQLAASSIGIAEFALAQPSLDDVFLALTGKAVEK